MKFSPFEKTSRRQELIASGVPFKSADAVFKCARRINSGQALLSAARYIEVLFSENTFYMAHRGLEYQVRRLAQLANQTMVEGR